MSAKIIVSYDGTANEDDAIALGGLFARAGADVSIAYVRHTHEPDDDRETLVQHEATALVERGVQLLGIPTAGRHVVTDRSTPEGLRTLAEQVGADAIVFCSDSHTAKGHIGIGNSAERLLEGGRTAIGIAPAGLAETDGDREVQRIVPIVEDGGDDSAERTARAPRARSRPRSLPPSTTRPRCWSSTRARTPRRAASR
jgi:nucleotide-binding universal stress UspA family protein